MKISCQSCGAKYNIADEKVRGKIVKIACKKCGARIEIDGREAAEQVQDQDETRVYDQAQAPAGAGAETWTVSVDDNDQRESTSGQIAELLQQGVINADTFVWRDGMADWLPIRDVPELASALSNDGSSSGYAASQPPAAQSNRPPEPAYEPEVPVAPAYPAPQIETAQAARLGGSRRGGAVDLFATQAAPEDEDVATSAPAAGGGGGGMFGGGGLSEVSSGKPIGARNENSVLFSLSALTASGPSNAPAATVGGDDEKSGLIDIQKLAASAKPGAKGDDRAKLDDIMNLGGGGAFGAALGAPILAPPPAAALEASTSGGAAEEKKGGKGMLFVVIGLAAVVVALVLVLVLKGGGDDKKEAAKGKDDKSETKKDDKSETKKDDKSEKKDPAVGGDPTAKSTGTDSPPDPGTGGPIGQPGTSSSVKGGTPAVPGKPGVPGTPGTAPAAASTTAKAGDPPPPGAKPGCKSLEECMGSPKPGGDPPKDPPKAAGAEFDKGAATSSLKAVPYKDCGSGGAGKVSVTFSPSGSVAGASVTAGDYDGPTKSCIAGRFRGAKVPAFSGDPKTVGWSINL